MSFHDVISQISKIRFRLKYGVKEELLTLLKLKGVGRVRARKLFSAGVKDIGHVKTIDFSSLSQLFGHNIAANIKKQVGEDIALIKVPDKKRKGQLSLNKYT